MARKKIIPTELVRDAMMLASIRLLNRWMDDKEQPFVVRDGNEERLKRNLNIVNLVYHALGIFYNE